MEKSRFYYRNRSWLTRLETSDEGQLRHFKKKIENKDVDRIKKEDKEVKNTNAKK